MSGQIVPPQPVLRESLERPATRFFGKVACFWGGSGGLLGTICLWGPRFAEAEPDLDRIAWWLVGSTLALALLTIILRCFERPRVVRRWVSSGSLGGVIH
jgi:predicted benzoate:H+ symporter BenE